MSFTVGGSLVSIARLQLRQIGDEARHQSKCLRALGAQLIHLRTGRDDLAFQRALGLPSSPCS